MTLPTFLGIGVPRGGTTWLHTLLASHPRIYVPERRKEVRFFDRHFDRGLEWYEAFFAASDERERYQAIGEISPQYLYGEECAERIASALPGVRLLAMLRHPVDRAYSQYGFGVQRRNFRGSFEEYLASRPKALEMGFYSRFLARYLTYFDREQLLPLVFEEVFANVDAARGRVADFLGVRVDGFDRDAAVVRVNASTVPTFRGASGLAVTVGRRLRRWGLEGVVDFGRRHGVQRAIATGQRLPPLDEGTRAKLSRQYADEFDELEHILDLDLSLWRG
jgi:hypothetical protein